MSGQRHSKKKNRRTTDVSDIPRRPVEVAWTDWRQGLTREQAAERMACGWDNRPVDSSMISTKDIIKENVFTYFNLIFLILAVLLVIVRSYRDLSFLLIIAVNTLIGIFQEVQAKKELEKMNMMAAPKISAVRDGKLKSLPVEKLVRDDIVLFLPGVQICADAEVVHGEARINESLLTGESDEITKGVGDKLVSGSYVVSGKCYARLTGVGCDSYIAKLTLEAKAMKKGEQSQMIRSLNRLLIFVGIVLIPIGITLFVQSCYINEVDFSSSITSMVAALIGMIPEGLFLLVSVALAVSAVRLGQKKVLVHDMKSIETLARVDVLCVDKTGTITDNTMQVKRLIPAQGYDPETMPDLERLVGDFAGAMGHDNATMDAVKSFFREGTGQKARKVWPFSSAVKYSAAAFEKNTGVSDHNTYVLGAPEFVLREDFARCEAEISGYTSRGYRVMVFAFYMGEPDGKPLTAQAVPLGYILMSNPVRKEAPATFSYFAEQGVTIKVISGDNPLTVVEAAKEAQIRDAEKYIDARKLKTKEDISRAVQKYTVFGRVTPAQKRQFVRALKAQGHTVAMTGDGVNDVPALKDADCSVAMASGSEVASQVAQVVLLDSNFASMPDVVAEGRRVVNNLECSASLFLVKNIFSFLMSLFSVIFFITYPLEPAQISLISMFTIGIPAFFLALQPNTSEIRGHFLSNVFAKALPAGITDMIAVGALVMFGRVFEVPESDISTAATMLLAIVGFMVLIRIGGPMNRTKWIIWGGCIGALLFSSIFFPHLFAITGMSAKCVMLFVVFSIATVPVLQGLTIAVGWLREMLRKRGQKAIN
ncbi:MAG: cation-translocating P-type ATPase [Lachnospiraceae bacterium]|nr:cation-translocating P-type ATPase [Lachnospiraceae bacterium]